MYSGSTACAWGEIGTIILWSHFCPTVMWSAIPGVRMEPMLVKALNKFFLSHFISGAKGVSQTQDSDCANKIVYSYAGVR